MPDTAAIRDGYDRIAGAYAQNLFDELAHKPLDRELLRRFAAGIRAGGEVCDIGCGPGHVARFLRGEGVNVFGLDLSPRMIDEARRLTPEIDFRAGDMLALDIPDRTLAGIAAFYAIVNFAEYELPPLFAEWSRVLEPGGSLLVAFHAGDNIIREPELWGVRVAMNFHYLQPRAVCALMESAGFDIEDVIEREPYPGVEHQSRRAYVFARK